MLINGTFHYLEVERLSKLDIASLYGGYPIYRKFKVIDSKVAKINEPIGPGWVPQADYQEYWNPFPEFTKQYRVYSEDDEYTQQTYDGRPVSPNDQDPSGVFTSGIATFNAPSKPGYRNVEPGSLESFSGSGASGVAIFRAAPEYVLWEELKKWSQTIGAKDKNPYEGANVQVWVKISGNDGLTSKTGATYWKNPLSRNFYVISSRVSFVSLARSREGRPGTRPLGNQTEDSLTEGKILDLIVQGNTRAQAIEKIESGKKPAPAGAGAAPAVVQVAGAGAGGRPGTRPPGRTTNLNGSPTERSVAPKAAIKATVRVRGNFGFVAPGEPEGGESQMVQYFKSGDSQLQTTARHFFLPKPNQINYQNLGSEWTEIERVGRIPLVDWKNFRLMKVSFEFLVIPDNTYRTGAFGETADDGITFSIDEKLENLRNMAARPYPVILYGFDDLLMNSNPFSMSTGAGVQFVINELSISSLIRTATGSINRATCNITLQEVPIEYINIISLPKLVPGQIIPPPPTLKPPVYSALDTFVSNIKSNNAGSRPGQI